MEKVHDADLPRTATRTYEYFRTFEPQLIQRGSYRRYQQGQPSWSTWSTGPYTFSPYKVLWKEMSGNRFCAAYIGRVDDAVLGARIAIPDHKLYFVPMQSLDEAAYLTGILNAPTVVSAISAYAAQLSLGTSVIENLKIPAYDPAQESHRQLAELAKTITQHQGNPTQDELEQLDRLAFSIVSQHQ